MVLSNRTIGLLVAVLAVGLVAAGCGGGGAAPSGGETGGGQQLTVELSSFAFEPSQITLQQGREVKVTLVSKDIEHTFTVPDLGIDFPVGAGGTKTVSFTPQQTGTFKLLCIIPGHTEAGMVGSVTVQ